MKIQITILLFRGILVRVRAARAPGHASRRISAVRARRESDSAASRCAGEAIGRAGASGRALSESHGRLSGRSDTRRLLSAEANRVPLCSRPLFWVESWACAGTFSTNSDIRTKSEFPSNGIASSPVGQAFYSALAAQEVVHVREKLLALTGDAVATAHQLANRRASGCPDVLQAEVEAEQAQVDYMVAQRTYTQMFREFGRGCGASRSGTRPAPG